MNDGVQTNIVQILSRNCTDIDSYEITGTPFNSIVYQFSLDLAEDHPYDNIKSAVSFRADNRLEDLELRPGPVKMREWSKRGIKEALNDTIEKTTPPIEVKPKISAHTHEKMSLWRTHVVSTRRERVIPIEVAKWIDRFSEKYRQVSSSPDTYNTSSVDTQQNQESEYIYIGFKQVAVGPDRSCWDCEEKPVHTVVEGKVTSNVNLHLGVCSECSTKLREMPFIST